MQKILLLEDDPLLATTLEELLCEEGFDVTLVHNGEAAIDATFGTRFDLYLFDVNVPRLSGFELLKALREANDTTPTFFITALSDLRSLEEGFSVGANDYIKKPFDLDELLIRIKARFSQTTKSLTHDDIVLDLTTHTLTKASKNVDLPRVQYEIFRVLIEHQGQVVDSEHLLDLLETPSVQALRVHITKLKNRLDLALTNVRGVGYRLERA